MAQIYYSIKKNRLDAAFKKGMEADPDVDGGLILTDDPVRRLYLPPIDSAEERAEWGRLFFETDITDEMVLYVYAYASDQETFYDENGTYKIFDFFLSDAADQEKKHIFSADAGARFVGKEDILLYGLSGRFLYLAIDVIGEGSGRLGRLTVDRRGDQFMDTFPAVFRERNSFFHRFLSVFSSVYNDFDRTIDELPALIDANKAPKELLLIFGSWLGIDLSGEFLSEEAMRTFVREGYQLNRMKGTKPCLERVLEIVLGERAIILEQNTIKSYLEKGDMVDTSLEKNSIYDVNILIKKKISETDRHQLLHLLKQFTPIRSRIHLIPLKESGALDTDIYMDMNAMVSEETYGILDDDMVMDDEVIMD